MSITDKFYVCRKCETQEGYRMVCSLEEHDEQIRAEALDEVITIINLHHFDNNKGDFDMLIHNLCKEVKLLKEEEK